MKHSEFIKSALNMRTVGQVAELRSLAGRAGRVRGLRNVDFKLDPLLRRRPDVSLNPSSGARFVAKPTEGVPGMLANREAFKPYKGAFPDGIPRAPEVPVSIARPRYEGSLPGGIPTRPAEVIDPTAGKGFFSGENAAKVGDHFRNNWGKYLGGTGLYMVGSNQGYNQGSKDGFNTGFTGGYNTGFQGAQSQAENTGFLGRLFGNYNFDPEAGRQGLTDEMLQAGLENGKASMANPHRYIPFFG